MNLYRKSSISMIGHCVAAMRQCLKHPESEANSFIYQRNQAQASILLGIVESIEKIKARPRTDTVVNMEDRLAVIKEKLNV